jgi:tetratricopeptide (TPR) repeat protein
LCRRLDRRIDPAVLRGLGLASLAVCRFDRARRYARSLLDQDDDPIALVEGHYLMGVSQFWRGELADSCTHLRAAIDSYQPELGTDHRARFAQDPKGICLVRLAFTTMWCGDVAGGQELADEAHEFVASIDHPYTLVYALGWLAMVAAESGDRDRLEAHLAESHDLAAVQPLGYAGLVVALMRGWLDVLDERSGALERVEAVVDELHATESVHYTYALGLLARGHQKAGDADRARTALQAAIDWGLAHDQRYLEPELLRIEAPLLAAAGDRAGADQALDRALDLATVQGAGLLVERIEAECSRNLIAR